MHTVCHIQELHQGQPDAGHHGEKSVGPKASQIPGKKDVEA